MLSFENNTIQRKKEILQIFYDKKCDNESSNPFVFLCEELQHFQSFYIHFS